LFSLFYEDYTKEIINNRITYILSSGNTMYSIFFLILYCFPAGGESLWWMLLQVTRSQFILQLQGTRNFFSNFCT